MRKWPPVGEFLLFSLKKTGGEEARKTRGPSGLGVELCHAGLNRLFVPCVQYVCCVAYLALLVSFQWASRFWTSHLQTAFGAASYVCQVFSVCTVTVTSIFQRFVTE